MQGFCQIAKFTVPGNVEANGEDIPVDYILISRRSKHRPGLRYQRRGIDEAAHVANFVETETIMRIEVGMPICAPFTAKNDHFLIQSARWKGEHFCICSNPRLKSGHQLTFEYLTFADRFTVPLFWTQTGYGLKPPPLLATDRTHEQHLDALKRHFLRTVPAYGPLVCFHLCHELCMEG